MQKEWATAHFHVWVATKSSGSMSRQWVPCRDSGFSVATGFGLGRVSLVERGVFPVMTKCFSLGFLSRQEILCLDRVWPRPRGLVLRHSISVS